MIACLNVVVLAMAAYVVLDEPAVIVHASESAGAASSPTPEERPAVVAAVDRVELPKAHETIAPEVPGAPKSDGVETREAKPATTTRRTTSKPRARTAAESPKPVESSREAAPAPAKKDLPIECIVDPASCDGGRKQPATEAQGPRTRAPAEDLPETLSQSALRTGFARVRASAKACAAKHGAAPGDAVEVKVSIAGGTGKVIAADALGSHAKSPLGSCVANALSSATFDRFAKAQIGLKYTVRL